MRAIANLLALVSGLGLALCAEIAFGQQAQAVVMWSVPARYTDGTPIPLADFGPVVVSWTQEGATSTGTASVDMMQGRVVVSAPCGVFWYSATYMTTATAKFPNQVAVAPPVRFDTGRKCAVPNAPQRLTFGPGTTS